MNIVFILFVFNNEQGSYFSFCLCSIMSRDLFVGVILSNYVRNFFLSVRI